MRLLPALVLLAVLLLAGCSGNDGAADGGADTPADDPGVPDGDAEAPDDGPDGGNQTAPDDDGEENATAPREPATWRVTIQGNDFMDGSLTVQVGDTVVWTHEDGTTPHTVTADDGAFDSGSSPADYMTQVNNPEFSHTFDEVGEFPYHCVVHPSMRDTVTVLERHDATP